ncbi:MAG: hypothetical protein EU541_05950 [Promethearchaeota archaeon]|nr:MAG: hypothetical protein EU541_05950 [Candidatus Lokiarchaeota archaeon]
MPMDITSIIVLATLVLVFIVFLFFDIFGREERYRYLAYIVALIPVNYIWAIDLFSPNTIMMAYIILFVLWILCLLRDTLFVYRKTKEYDDIFLFFVLAVIIQVIVSGVLPELWTPLKALEDTIQVLYFYLPFIFASDYTIYFQVLVTVLGLFLVIPMLLDIKNEPVPFPWIVILTLIFLGPILLFSFIWWPDGFWVLGLLLSVLLFILLLAITRSGKESSVSW